MGSASRRAENGGSFGSKQFIVSKTNILVEDPDRSQNSKGMTLLKEKVVEHIISVRRPSRGRNLWKINKMARKGFKPFKLGALKKVVKTAEPDSSPSVKNKASSDR